MAGTSVIKQVPPKDVLFELRRFVSHSFPPSENLLQLVRKAFPLLRSVPASKDVALEFFSSIFDRSVAGYMNELENISRNSNQAQSNSEDSVILKEIHSYLKKLMNTLPGWSMVVFKWSLDLLGTLSSKYSGRGRAPVNGMLSDSLQQWMSCKATFVLIDLSTTSMQCLVNTHNSSECFNTLLDLCDSYTPHFDWVVACITQPCYYPNEVIANVFEWGLSDYSQNEVTGQRTGKLNSVIRILIHLASSYLPIIKQTMLKFVQFSLSPTVHADDKSNLEKAAAVPFLMKLASHSPVLLSALIEVSSKSFTPDLFREMNRFSDQWVKFAGGRQALLDLVVHLILYTEDSAEYIMNLLLDTTRHPDKVVAATAEEILELLIKELDVSVRVNSAKIPLLDCILKNLDGMLSSLISDEELRVSTSVTIFSLIGQHHPNILADCVSYILLRSTNDDHLASVVKLTQGYKASDILSPAIVLSLGGDRCKDPIPPNLFWINLSKLLKWEASGTLTSLPMQEAVWANLVAITELLYSNEDVEVAHSMAEVTKRAVLGSKSQPSIHLIMTLVQATVTYFYICLTHSGLEQLKGLRVVNSLLSKLSQSSQAGRAMAFRELLESALFKAPSVLFGAVPEPTKRLIQPASNLLMDNHKHGISILLTQRHSSVFHAGVIGNGKRKMAPSCPTPADTVVENTHLLIMALKACCSNENPQGALDAVISMALLLVELISPDVMYNGLPWPEEEFCKVTVERDLYIRRVFDNVPLLWSLLAYIAYHRPALCYCSVLLRALIATLLGQWTSVGQQGQKAGQCKSLASTTMKVLQLMSLSQLLPPPLSALGNVIEHLPPNQVVLVLRDCVWNYMRDHVPSPALFSRDSNGAMWRDPSTSRPPKQYTETLRLVMLKNISSLGPLYNTLFVQEDIMDED